MNKQIYNRNLLNRLTNAIEVRPLIYLFVK